MKRHKNIVDQLSALVNNVEQRFLGDSLEAGEYLLALEDLSAMQLGFKDVQMLIFRPKLNVFINLLGLHYCILGLNVLVTYSSPFDQCLFSFIEIKDPFGLL